MYTIDAAYPHSFDCGAGGVITFALDGKPVPLDRHRLARSHFYSPQKKEKQQFVTCLRQIMVQCSVLEKPIHSKRASKLEMEVVFYLAATGSKSPDVDNLAKFVMDVCSGEIYRDDIQVFRLIATKVPRKTPQDVGKTVVTVRPWTSLDGT